MKENIRRLLASSPQGLTPSQLLSWEALTPREKLIALYKKLMFLEINETLKAEGFTRRYRRPIPLDGFSQMAASGFNVFLSRSIKVVLQRFFANLTAAGVLASPLPFSNGKVFSRDESYQELSLCPVNHFPYKTFPPEKVASISQTDFSSLQDHQIKELFQNLTTFAPHGHDFSAFLNSNLHKEGRPKLTPSEMSELNKRIDISLKYDHSLHHSPPFESPLLLHSITKERSSHCYSLTFCIRDTDYYNFLCSHWSLSWATRPSPFVTHSFVSGVNPGLWNIHWIYVNVDYTYLIPEGGDVQLSAEACQSPRTFDHFIRFFDSLQDFFSATFVKYYEHRFFTSGDSILRRSPPEYKTPYESTLFDPPRVSYLKRYMSNVRSFAETVAHEPSPSAAFATWNALSGYLTELEPFLALSRFLKLPMTDSHAAGLFREGDSPSEDGARPLFPFCLALADEHRAFLAERAVQAYLSVSGLLDIEGYPLRDVVSPIAVEEDPPAETLSPEGPPEQPPSAPSDTPQTVSTMSLASGTDLTAMSFIRMVPEADSFIRTSGLMDEGVIEQWTSSAQETLPSADLFTSLPVTSNSD